MSKQPIGEELGIFQLAMPRQRADLIRVDSAKLVSLKLRNELGASRHSFCVRLG